jgi:peptidoglycan/xylan/chitin deacetylase (PgdA/CDA1 family)
VKMTARPTLPQNFLSSEGTLLDAFAATTGWGPISDTVVSLDTANFLPGQSSSVRLYSATGNVYAEKVFLGMAGVVISSVELWYYVADSTKCATVTVTLQQDGMTKRYVSTSANILDGWNCIKLGKHNFTKTGTPEWNALNVIRLQAAAKNGTVIDISFGALYISRSAQPIAMIQFDNGYKEVYENAYPILAAAGIKATCGIVSSWVPDTTYYMSLAQLQELYAAGWDMANHTTAHGYLGGVSVADDVEKMRGCSEYLEANGMPRAARHVIYPAGQYSALYTFPALVQLGIKTARCIWEGELTWPLANTNRMNAYQMTTTRGVAAVLAMIDNSIAAGIPIILYTHFVKPAGTATLLEIDTTFLQTVVDYLVSKRVRCMTIDEWYNGLTNPRYRSLPLTRTPR